MSDPGIPLTSCARDAVKAALRIASDRGVATPTTEDLLLGLVEQRSALVVRVLEQLGVYASVTEALERLDPSSRSSTPATVAIQVAVAEATARSEPFLGGEHLLWGLLDDSAGTSAELFEALGVRPEVRAAIAELLGERGAA